jgi:hypothetical protein
MKKLDSAVALFIYNREDTLVQVLDVLAEFSPPIIFLIGDGPKDGCLEDAAKVSRVRELAVSSLENHILDCKFAPKNLGLRKSFEEGFDHIFSKVDKCIFLEDDTVPKSSFFPYCDELLITLKDNPRVLSISGTNLVGKNSPSSFHYSKYPQMWGWATWRDKWQPKYDSQLSEWRFVKRRNAELRKLGSSENIRYWARKFDAIINFQTNTWDTQVAYMFLFNNFLSAIPSRNLVTNIGFGRDDATNTRGSSGIGNLIAFEIEFPLVYPTIAENWSEFDVILSQRYSIPSIGKRVLRKLWKFIK